MNITKEEAQVLLNNLLGDYNDETIINGSPELDQIIKELQNFIREENKPRIWMCPICGKRTETRCPLCFTMPLLKDLY